MGIGELMRTASFKDKARKQLGIKVDEADENIERQIMRQRDSNKARQCRPAHISYAHGCGHTDPEKPIRCR